MDDFHIGAEWSVLELLEQVSNLNTESYDGADKQQHPDDLLNYVFSVVDAPGTNCGRVTTEVGY